MEKRISHKKTKKRTVDKNVTLLQKIMIGKFKNLKKLKIYPLFAAFLSILSVAENFL